MPSCGYVYVSNLPFFQWHATVPQTDEKLTKDVLRQAFRDNLQILRSGKWSKLLGSGTSNYRHLTLANPGVVAQVFADVPANPPGRTFAGYVFIHTIGTAADEFLTPL